MNRFGIKAALAALALGVSSSVVTPVQAQTVNGWRVQVFATAETDLLQQEMTTLRTAVDGAYAIYVIEEGGLFKLRFGDFARKRAALAARESAYSWGYDQAWIPRSEVAPTTNATPTTVAAWPDHENITLLKPEDVANDEGPATSAAASDPASSDQAPRHGEASSVEPPSNQPLVSDLDSAGPGLPGTVPRQTAFRRGASTLGRSANDTRAGGGISIDGHLTDDGWSGSIFFDITGQHDAGTYVAYQLDGDRLLVGVSALYAPRFTLRSEIIREDPPQIAEAVVVHVTRPGMDQPLMYAMTIQGDLTQSVDTGSLVGSIKPTTQGWEAELAITLPPATELPREGLRVRVERSNPPM